MKTIDFAKTHKHLYTAKRKIEEVTADTGVFLAVEGQGTPGGDAFQQAIGALYTTALYTVKFTLKPAGVVDFKVGKVECLYLSEPGVTPMDQWCWRMLVRVPEEVTAGHLAAAKKAVREKKGTDLSAVKRLRWKEGRTLQVLHVGPYDQVGQTYCQLQMHAVAHGLALTGPAHEIYLNDPRRTAPEKLKTIVRMGVKKKPTA